VYKPLREQRRLRAFENRALRRIFGPMREEVRGGWRELHNEELFKISFFQKKKVQLNVENTKENRKC
jgi:hypothetical protein